MGGPTEMENVVKETPYRTSAHIQFDLRTHGVKLFEKNILKFSDTMQYNLSLTNQTSTAAFANKVNTNNLLIKINWNTN